MGPIKKSVAAKYMLSIDNLDNLLVVVLGENNFHYFCSLFEAFQLFYQNDYYPEVSSLVSKINVSCL